MKKIRDHDKADDNQTFLEKIFWKIFNYRLFRVYLSALLFVYFQSKFTLMRTMTWGIRLLRWVKVGILLGFIDPSQQSPQTPTIDFHQDSGNAYPQGYSMLLPIFSGVISLRSVQGIAIHSRGGM